MLPPIPPALHHHPAPRCPTTSRTRQITSGGRLRCLYRRGVNSLITTAQSLRGHPPGSTDLSCVNPGQSRESLESSAVGRASRGSRSPACWARHLRHEVTPEDLAGGRHVHSSYNVVRSTCNLSTKKDQDRTTSGPMGQADRSFECSGSHGAVSVDIAMATATDNVLEQVLRGVLLDCSFAWAHA